MNNIKQLIKKFIPNKILEKRKDNFFIKQVLFNSDSFIISSGLWRSIKNNTPFDQSGKPLPWICYPMITFLKERLKKDMILFEYGSGYSTLFFADYVREVYSVEYDEVWYKKINALNKKLSNIHVAYKALNDGYAESIANLEEKLFDVIFIDGRKRVQCCMFSINFLKDNGIVILDDSEREKYQEAFTFFARQGFAHISLRGMKPTDCRETQSTIFYKRGNNCFNI